MDPVPHTRRLRPPRIEPGANFSEFRLQGLDAGMKLARVDSGLDEQVLGGRKLLPQFGILRC